jgi:hypothetical protein
MQTFEWLASNSGPKGCPMEILDGDLLFPGGALYIPKASVHAGWGRQVSQHVVGAERKPLPDSVAVLFFSYLENQLYRAALPLPRDSIARLFQEGFRAYDDPAGRGTYDALVVGVAPGGAVAVWASGTERQVEVAFGRAEPVDLDWHRAMEAPPDVDRRAFVESELADAATRDPLVPVMRRQVPVGRWAAYRTRYKWRPTFEGMGAPRVLYRVEFVNGERANVELPLAGADERAGLPAPRRFLADDPQSGRRLRPQFDEEEITAAFARAGAGGRPVELVFAAPAPGAADPRVLVRGGGETVELRKVTYLR